MDLQSVVRRNMVVSLVQRHMFCPVTRNVLDVRKCVVLVDKDGDPAAVLSQAGWAEIVSGNLPDTLAAVESMSLTVDPETVRS